MAKSSPIAGGGGGTGISSPPSWSSFFFYTHWRCHTAMKQNEHSGILLPADGSCICAVCGFLVCTLATKRASNRCLGVCKTGDWAQCTGSCQLGVPVQLRAYSTRAEECGMHHCFA